MKKPPEAESEQDMLDEYDFSAGVRGKYAERYAAGSNVVVLSPTWPRSSPIPGPSTKLSASWPSSFGSKRGIHRFDSS